MVEGLLFNIRGAMLRYGTAFKADDQDGIRSTTTEACELLNRLATYAYAEGRNDEREQWEPVAWEALAALNTCDGDKDGYKGPAQWFNEDAVNAAINRICATICPSCLGHGYTAAACGSGWGGGGPDATVEYEPCDCGLSGKAAK